jgi:hypothetical protein
VSNEFNADWFAAQLQGERRDFMWYVVRGIKGDQRAAQRALAWIVDSLTPEALAQNSGAIDPQLASVLREQLQAYLSDDIGLLRIARKVERGRPRDIGKAERTWWQCVRAHRLLSTGRAPNKTKACEMVLDEDGGGMEVQSLVDEFAKLERALNAYAASRAADPE